MRAASYCRSKSTWQEIDHHLDVICTLDKRHIENKLFAYANFPYRAVAQINCLFFHQDEYYTYREKLYLNNNPRQKSFLKNEKETRSRSEEIFVNFPHRCDICTWLRHWITPATMYILLLTSYFLHAALLRIIKKVNLSNLRIYRKIKFFFRYYFYFFFLKANYTIYFRRLLTKLLLKNRFCIYCLLPLTTEKQS